MADPGGSIQPYQPKDDEVLAHLSDGGWYDNGGDLPPGVTIYRNGGAHIPVLTAEQVERALAWLRDHHRDGGFGCPSSTAE